MIVTVTPNPALDITWEIDRIEPGESHRADSAAVRAGGKGVNVARVAHAEGYRTCAIVTTGGATGEEFRAELAASGTPFRAVPVAASTRRSAAWVDRALGDTTIVNERGSALTDTEWASVIAAVREEAASARVLVVSGSMPPETPDIVLSDLIAAGRTAGIPVVVDTSGPALLRAADAGANVLKPNAVELREATGLSDPLDGARELIRRGAERVLLSMGAEGMWLVTADAVISARLPEALSGNPTGAGDAAVSAVATLLSEGITDPETLLRRATAWSASAVLMPLAGEISPLHTQLESTVIIGHPTPKDPE